MFKDISVGFNSGRLKHISESFPKAIKEFESVCKGEIVGIKTGIADIDEQTGGIRKGEYVIFGGRPAVGKTSIGLSVANNMANQGYKVGIFSIEVKAESIIFKLCSMNSTHSGSEIPYSMFRGITKANRDDLEQFKTEVQKLKEKNIFINDSSRTTISDIVSEVRRFIRAEGLDVVMVDHIGIVKADNQANIKRHERLQQFSMELAGLFKDEDVAGLVLVQLKRSEKNETPTMDSLGESSQFEKDAHLIYLLHQPDFNNPTSRLLVCAKARDAKAGAYALHFSTSTTECSSMSEWDSKEYQNSLNGNLSTYDADMF
jgi:replicative DNA helicase